MREQLDKLGEYGERLAEIPLCGMFLTGIHLRRSFVSPGVYEKIAGVCVESSKLALESASLST